MAFGKKIIKAPTSGVKRAKKAQSWQSDQYRYHVPCEGATKWATEWGCSLPLLFWGEHVRFSISQTPTVMLETPIYSRKFHKEKTKTPKHI